LTGINGIRSKIKSSSEHIKAAGWGKKFWNLSHGAILVNTHEFG